MIAIIGAGITGLALAHELAARGAEFVVLEGSEHVGGVIRSARVNGALLEWGPQRTRLTAAFRALVDDLGLAAELVTAPSGLPLMVYAAGRLREVPYSARGWLTGPLLSPVARARLLLEPFTAGPRDGESVARYLSRKLGREAYLRVAGPLYGGLYASDPADMSMGISLGRVLREMGAGRSLAISLLRRGGRITPPPACSFRDGLATLPRALHARHASRVRLGTAVEGMEPRGEGFRLTTAGGSVDADSVVITTPAPSASRLLAGVAPDAASRIGMLNYNPLAVVHLEADVAALPRGLGYQVSFEEPLMTRGVTFNHAMFDRPGICTAYLGGARHPAVARLADEEIAGIAVEEFRRVTGAAAGVLSVSRERMPAWDRSWGALEGLGLPAGIHLAANWESRPGIPGRLQQAGALAARLAPVGR